jgi:LysR family transcriptional regulator (chromosome initiation inhibitor)
MLVRKVFRRAIDRPQQSVPTAEGFGAAVRVSDVHPDVPLFWQCRKLDSPAVKTIAEAVQTAASSRRPQRR